MISIATGAARAGDVFTSSYGNSNGTPLDLAQSSFDAVKAATAKGICYAYSAGNSGRDLATLSNRYSATAPGSGGFIIGGTNGSQTVRANGSNYGAKVVANGWYSNVTTLGYGNLFYPSGDLQQTYTTNFGGTSAAAPQVAGVIASIQGAAKRQNGAALTPSQVRSLLKTHGTNVTGNIGKRPDLWKIMNAIKANDGMRITQEGSVGGQVKIELTVPAGRGYMMLGSLGRKVLNIGLNRRVLLDLTSTFPVISGTMGGTGQQVFQLNVPNDNSLHDKSLFLQTLDFTASAHHLTNSVDLYIK